MKTIPDTVGKMENASGMDSSSYAKRLSIQRNFIRQGYSIRAAKELRESSLESLATRKAVYKRFESR